jgi:4-hydroxybenzoate polyprenyltransferase
VSKEVDRLLSDSLGLVLIKNGRFMAAHLDSVFQRRRISVDGGQACYSFLERIFSFLTLNAILVAFTTTSILYVACLLLNIFNAPLLLACFFLTVCTYNLNRLTDFGEDSINAPERADYTEKHHTRVLLTVTGSAGAALLFAFFCDLSAVLVVFLAICAAFLYSVRVFGFRLKDVLVVKNVTIAGTSVMCAAALPLAVHVGSYVAISLIGYFVFIKVFINTVLFDVRDIGGDRLAGAATIPVSLGRQKTRGLLLGLNSTLLPWVAISIFQGLWYKFIPILAASVVYGYWYIFRLCSSGATKRTSVDLLVDGEWVLIALVVAVFAATAIGPTGWSSLGPYIALL